MTTIEAGLRLFAWLSPAFPTGAFAYSHGLEWAIEKGEIRNAGTLHDWLQDILLHGTGLNDAILLRHAHRAARDPHTLAAIAELATALAPAQERQSETLSQGAAFMRAVAAWPCPALPEPAPYPVAVGAATGWNGIDPHMTTAIYLQAFTSNLISAAVRLIPLGQSAGLAVLSQLEPLIARLERDTREATLDEIGGCAFRSDIAAMRHETQYTRLFRS